jgi:hypothetical protein
MKSAMAEKSTDQVIFECTRPMLAYEVKKCEKGKIKVEK